MKEGWVSLCAIRVRAASKLRGAEKRTDEEAKSSAGVDAGSWPATSSTFKLGTSGGAENSPTC